MTDERRAEILAMKYYRIQAELLRIETAMNEVPLSQWPREVLEEYRMLEGAEEINEGTGQADLLLSHHLRTTGQWE